MIDDDISARETFGIMLAEAGYDFVGAENGCDGIRLAEACQPGVAIVDLRLPDRSGIDVLSVIRNLSPLTVLVLLTAFWDLKAEFDAKSAGAWACVDKPLWGDELLELVRLALDAGTRHSLAEEVNIVRVQPPVSHGPARLIERLTMFIGAPTDEPTLRGFGRAIGVSRGGFRNWCKTAGLKARSVRDFARGLRAAWHLEHEPSFEPADLLDIIDERTMRTFCRTSGGALHGFPRTVEGFLKQQAFIMNPGFVASVRTALSSTRFEANTLTRRWSL
jgi:CheY-like chemotaxis protein